MKKSIHLDNLSKLRYHVSILVVFVLSSVQAVAGPNEYESKFAAISQKAQEKYSQFLALVNRFNTQGDIPRSRVDRAGYEYNSLRHPLVLKYSWAIPNDEALSVIKEYSPIIEIGAGSGYWAKLLTDIGTDVLAIDNFKDEGTPMEFTQYWLKPTFGDETTLDSHPNRTLFLCWPDPRTHVALNSLQRYSGEYVIYVGYSGGKKIMGDPKFFTLLDKNFTLVKQVPIPQWPGNEDALFVYKRNSSDLGEESKATAVSDQSLVKDSKSEESSAPQR